MRIAYIVLAHRLPQQLARLIDRLSNSESTFFVHLDKSADRRLGFDLERSIAESLEDRADLVFVKRHACYWASFRIVAATLEGIAAIVRSGKNFDRVVLLSGQDYPIKPISQISSYLATNSRTEFIESFLLTAPNRWSDHGGPYNAETRVMYRHLHFRSRIWTLPWRRSFLRGLQPYGGSQWWALSMDCVSYVWEYVQRERRLTAYFRNVFIPDEHFFHTIVANSPFGDRMSGHDLTFADWSQPTPPYPATLGQGYFEALFASEKLFARKFDTSHDAGVLDLIDERLLAAGKLPLAVVAG